MYLDTSNHWSSYAGVDHMISAREHVWDLSCLLSSSISPHAPACMPLSALVSVLCPKHVRGWGKITLRLISLSFTLLFQCQISPNDAFMMQSPPTPLLPWPPFFLALDILPSVPSSPPSEQSCLWPLKSWPLCSPPALLALSLVAPTTGVLTVVLPLWPLWFSHLFFLFPQFWHPPMPRPDLPQRIIIYVSRSPAQVGCMRHVLGAGTLGRPRAMGWGGRWEGGVGWGIHVNPWLILVNVWQNPL